VFSGPNTEPITSGNRLKKEPHPTPLTTEKSERIPMLDAKGQIANALTLHRKMATAVLLRGPRNVSDVNPAKMRPNVDETFQMESAMIPVELELLIDRAKMGMKYDGTMSGKQAIAEPKSSSQN
jgi:hypothetical protein